MENELQPDDDATSLPEEPADEDYKSCCDDADLAMEVDDAAMPDKPDNDWPLTATILSPTCMLPCEAVVTFLANPITTNCGESSSPNVGW